MPGFSAIIAPEHAAALSATPRTPVDQRVRYEARGTGADPERRCGGASLSVNDDYLAIGSDQDRH